MINIKINTTKMQTSSQFLSQVLEEFDPKPPFAVAVNGEFVPQSHYQQHVICEGDLIDVVAPIFGG